MASCHKKDISIFDSLFTNLPCIIVGSSPTINKVNLKYLEDKFTISINKSMFKIKPFIGFWQDIKFWEEDKTLIQSINCIKICTKYSDPNNSYFHYELIGGDFKSSNSCKKLYGSGSSGPLAVCLANAMGCSPIITIGLDCNLEGYNTDFFGKNKNWTNSTLSNCKKGLNWLKDNFSKDALIMLDSADIFNEFMINFDNKTSHKDLYKILDQAINSR